MRTTLRQMFSYEFILIYLGLLLFSGYYFFEYWTLPRMAIIGSLLLFGMRKITCVKRDVLQVLVFMLLNMVFSEGISSLINYYYAPSMLITGLTVLNLVFAFLFAQVIQESKFRDSFINCVVVISCVSLIAFVLYQVLPQMIEIFPELISSKGRSGYFLIFAIPSDFSLAGSHRNQGIFWEPGAFQVFVNLAYIFELSNERRKPRIWVLALCLMTVLTTYSTTGIITGILLLLFTLCRGKGALGVMRAAMAVTAIGVAIYYILPRLTGFLQYTLVSKLEMILSYQLGAQNAASSRIESILYPVLEFLKSPVWGIGGAGFAELAERVGHSMFTCTPVNWFANYGIFYGSVVLVGLWRFFRKGLSSALETVMITGIFLFSISSEALQSDIIVMAMCFYGFMKPHELPQRRCLFWRTYAQGEKR